MSVLLLLLLTACSGCSPYACSGAPPAPTAEPAPTLNIPPPDPNLKPAPTLDFMGLTIGASDAAQIEAWLTARSLTCRQTPSVRRTTFRYECGDGLTPALLPDRKISGQLSSLLLVRSDAPDAAARPLTHASTIRRYSLPERAAEDYEAAVTALTAAFGPPARTSAIDRAKLSAPLVRYASLWSFKDLQISLNLMRMGGTYWSVSERWDQPGVELSQPARTPATPPGFDRSKCKDPFCFDQPGMAPPGLTDPFGHDKKTPAPAPPAP